MVTTEYLQKNTITRVVFPGIASSLGITLSIYAFTTNEALYLRFLYILNTALEAVEAEIIEKLNI